MRTNFIKRIYTILLIIEFLIVVFTPTVIRDWIPFVKEEYMEWCIIFCVFVIWYFTYKGYEKQITKKQNLLEENFQYIWSINVQIDESAKILAEIKEYPQKYKDLIDMSYKIAEDTVKIFKLDSLLIKVVDTDTKKTIEKFFIGKKSDEEIKINNIALLNWEKIPNMKIITSETRNWTIKTFFIISKDSKIDSSNMNLIKSILIKIEMLFKIRLKK